MCIYTCADSVSRHVDHSGLRFALCRGSACWGSCHGIDAYRRRRALPYTKLVHTSLADYLVPFASDFSNIRAIILARDHPPHPRRRQRQLTYLHAERS
jgi:hypothetical protein